MSMTGQRTDVLAGGVPSGSDAEALVVLVVADSPSRARALTRLVTAPGFLVAAEVCTAVAAEAAVLAHSPGAVLIDLDPESGGIEAIERIMGTRPTPVVVCGALAEHSRAALAAGAVDVIGALDALPTSPQYVTALRRHLRVASRVRVITHPRSRLRAQGLGLSPSSRTSHAPGRTEPRVETNEPGSIAEDSDDGQRGVALPHPYAAVRGVRAIVIGASTGGPPALATILADLPSRLPVPILVIQHMADGFVEGLTTWLDGLSPLPVVLAEHGRRLRPGVVHVAPAGVNTLLRAGLRIELRPPPAGQFHVPGVDAAFVSAAETCGSQVVGVLLTGMGRDGAAGLRTLRDAGALTIGQDEPTSVVWGMPAAAQALGAVELELPLPAIGAAIAHAASEVWDGRR